LDIIRADAACDNSIVEKNTLKHQTGYFLSAPWSQNLATKKVRCMYRVPKLSLANSEQSPPTFGKFALENAAGSSWRAMREIFAVYTGRTVVLW
jgi:hypothetical protein